MAVEEHPDFSTYKLGHDHPVVEVDTSQALMEACTALFKQAMREIVIMSRDLDPLILDNTETSEALRQFLLGSRRAQLRILVKDAEPVARKGHRIVNLTQRLTSFAEIRVPAAEYSNHNTAYVVVDGTGVIYRGLANRFEATVSFNDRNTSRELLREFEQMWQTSLSAPSLRRMSL